MNSSESVCVPVAATINKEFTSACTGVVEVARDVGPTAELIRSWLLRHRADVIPCIPLSVETELSNQAAWHNGQSQHSNCKHSQCARHSFDSFISSAIKNFGANFEKQ